MTKKREVVEAQKKKTLQESGNNVVDEGEALKRKTM